MTLQALRQKVGEAVFFRILRGWASGNRSGNVTTSQFVDLAEHESGMDLRHFFEVWRYRPDKPTDWQARWRSGAVDAGC